MTSQPSSHIEQQAQSQDHRQSHLAYLRQTIDLASKSPPKPTNFRVGCVIVSNPSPTTSTSASPSQPQQPKILSTGYTLELAGNTHAEQCALYKLALSSSVLEEDLYQILTPDLNAVLYTSLEPCGKRLSGNLPCVQRIIATRQSHSHLDHQIPGGIRKVIFGAKEPGTFVQDSQSCRLLTEAGIEWEYIPDFEDEILRVAMEGHNNNKDETKTTNTSNQTEQQQNRNDGLSESTETKIEKIADEEQRRQEAAPRNPKKRMMEVPPS